MELIPGSNYLNSLHKGVERARTLFWQELRELQNPAHSATNLAAAFALGTLLSFIPVPLLDSMLVAVILARFKQINRAPLFMARLLWNDLLVFPLYGPGYRLGSALLAPMLTSSPEVTGMDTAVAPLLSLIVGSLLLAIGLAVAGYMLFWLGIQLYRLVGISGLPEGGPGAPGGRTLANGLIFFARRRWLEVLLYISSPRTIPGCWWR